MLVKELIEELLKCDQNKLVRVRVGWGINNIQKVDESLFDVILSDPDRDPK